LQRCGFNNTVSAQTWRIVTTTQDIIHFARRQKGVLQEGIGNHTIQEIDQIRWVGRSEAFWDWSFLDIDIDRHLALNGRVQQTVSSLQADNRDGMAFSIGVL
jgi:hypothetical protein